MTKTSTKRSLAMSILSLVLCLAMLIGSTYAWFSDEAETGPVNITAGNLDVEIVDKDATIENGKVVSGKVLSGKDESLFEKEPKLWEPGMMITSKEFKIANLGSLALQYKINVEAKMNDSKEPNLFERIKYKVVEKTADVTLPIDGSDLQTRLTFWNSIKDETDKTTGKITATEKVSQNPLVIVLFWEPDQSTAEDNADNQYNIRNDYETEKLTATFQVNVFATQIPDEVDSFGNQYDADAKIPVKIDNNQALEDAIEGGLQAGDIVELAEGNFESDTIEKIPEGVAIVGDTDEYGDPMTTVEIGGKDSDCVELKNNKISNIRFEKKLENDDRRPELLKIGDKSGETAFAVENCEFDYSADTSYSIIPSLEIVGPGTVKNCTFKGKKGIISDNVAGKILIEDCIFNTNSMPIHVTGGNLDSHLTIRKCEFKTSDTGLEIDSPDVTMEECQLTNTTLTVNGACNWKSNGNYFYSGSYIALWDSNITFTSTGDNFDSNNSHINGPDRYGNYLFMTNKGGSHDNIIVTVDGKLPKEEWFEPGTLANAKK